MTVGYLVKFHDERRAIRVEVGGESATFCTFEDFLRWVLHQLKSRGSRLEYIINE